MLAHLLRVGTTLAQQRVNVAKFTRDRVVEYVRTHLVSFPLHSPLPSHVLSEEPSNL